MGRKGRVRQNESDLDTILLQDFNKFLLFISCYDPVVLLAFLVNWIMPRWLLWCLAEGMSQSLHLYQLQQIQIFYPQIKYRF